MRVTMLLAVLIAVPAPAPAADRPTDKDVKHLIEQVNTDRDRFEDQLDGSLKHSVLRSPTGETNVAKYLDDLQTNVGNVKQRFSPTYSASSEVTTVLRQGSDIQRFMATQPPNFKGASEWNRLASSLGSLAAAYGTTFPLAESASARRMNDRELQQTCESVANAANPLKNALAAAMKTDKAASKGAQQGVNALKAAAKALASRLGDGKPASGEARALMDRAAAVRTVAAGPTLTPAGQAAWEAVQGGVAKIADGFGLSK